MSTQLIPVPFRDATLFIIDHEGEPHVPMKPVVEGMGLTWQGQHEKLKSNARRFCIKEIVIQMPSDDQRRNTICLPLRKLPGWLMTIHANKVKNTLRSTIIAYQNECDEVLWQHWTNRQPVAPQAAPLNPLDIILQQHQIVGSALAEIKRHDIALVQMDERLTHLENGYDATTVQKARLYEEMLKVDEKTGTHFWHLRLRERMRALGMNQTRLSFLLGVNSSTVSRWVKGTTVPSLDMLERIGLAMGLSLIEFLSPDNDLDFTASPDLL